jgi:hypothetical protein
MSVHEFVLDAVVDRGAVPKAAFELGAALGEIEGVTLTFIEANDSLGARRNGVLLAVAVSFATSLGAPAAYDALKTAISKCNFSYSIKVGLESASTQTKTGKAQTPGPSRKPSPSKNPSSSKRTKRT